MKFSAPQINLYSKDLGRTVAFYEGLGFIESFRTPQTDAPDHVELKLDGFTLGIATLAAARDHHGLEPSMGHSIEIVLQTDSPDEAVAALTAKGATLLAPPHDFLNGQLRAAWVADPDGNPVQLYRFKG
jgi:catechol 2,3-dioxygenase-like lactoylglutathione lyase family enzyme